MDHRKSATQRRADTPTIGLGNKPHHLQFTFGKLVISENFRVGEAKDALKAGELYTLGKLMFASHQSLKDFYEVSGKELDCIVDFCKTFPVCIGARMTGAGFGGCAIALVKKKSFENFTEKLTVYYEKQIGYKPEVFASDVGDGVTEII